MKKGYVIVADSCCDLDKETRAKYNIEYLKMGISYADKQFPASLDWDLYSPKELYDVMRGGERIFTSNVQLEEYLENFTRYIEEGYDVLSLSCSSALSSSYNVSLVAKEQVLAAHPTAKIYCIDTLISCLGQGILAIKAAKLRDEGKSIDEVALWVESNKANINQFATVEDLVYLKRAVRVTGASAFFGGIMQVKPIIISDAKGQNSPITKVRGRKTSLRKLVELSQLNIVKPEEQTILIGHADCYEDALYVKEELEKVINCQGIEIGYIGPIIGASVGPGTIGVYFYGNKVTGFATDN